jgi:hypothetical protein
VRHAERTGVHAVAAADAQIGIVGDGSIFRLGVRADRTCRHAVGMLAVHTVIDHRAAFQVGILPFDANARHPDAGLVHLDVVFHTASHHAGTAVNTACGVEEIGVMFDFSHDAPLRLFDRDKRLAERLTAADGICVGDVHSRVACADAVGCFQSLWRDDHIQGSYTHSQGGWLGREQKAMGCANLTRDLHPVPVF